MATEVHQRQDALSEYRYRKSGYIYLKRQDLCLASTGCSSSVSYVWNGPVEGLIGPQVCITPCAECINLGNIPDSRQRAKQL